MTELVGTEARPPVCRYGGFDAFLSPPANDSIVIGKGRAR